MQTAQETRASANRQANLRRLLSPRHVAVVGGEIAAVVIQQCRRIGYAGEIWPVNGRRGQIEGLDCYASVADLPAAPDAAFVAVSRDATLGVVRQLAARGAGGCVCYAAGYAEAGGEGTQHQQALVEAAGDLALVGPNCYGVLNLLEGVALWPDNHGCEPVERGAAIISQSGNIGINLTMQDRSLPLSHMISAGNQAVLGLGDYLAALVEDSRVAAIGLVLEGVNDVEAFSRAAARALERGVPIVVLKCGRSEAGARVTLSHTSSLAGDAVLYGALFDRLGIIAVDSLTKLIETLKLLTLAETHEIARFASMSCSGGEASLIADLAHDLGIAMPAMSERQVAGLRGQLPAFVTVSNPFDYNTSIWGDQAALTRCFSAVTREGFDAVALVLDFPRIRLPGSEAWEATLEAMIAACHQGRALGLVVSAFPELFPREARARAIAAGLVPLQGLEEAMTAIRAVNWYARRRREIDPARIPLPRPAALAGPAVVLDEWQSKQRLAPFGLALPEGHLTTADEAPARARELGFPVALKAVSADLPHKTEAGAVKLGLTSEAEVERAVGEIQAGLRGRPIHLPVDLRGFLVERMVPGAVAELIVGVKRDDRLGLALVIGSGGQLVELIGDRESLFLPTDRTAVERALDRLKAARLIAGFRGRPPGDRAAAVDAILAVADFAEHHRETLLELDVNPLLVLPQGEGAVAVDVLLRMANGGRG